MSYRCPECGNVFDSRHTVTFAECPRCGEAIDTEYDTYDEEEEDETDE